jgi:hypothetical protein
MHQMRVRLGPGAAERITSSTWNNNNTNERPERVCFLAPQMYSDALLNHKVVFFFEQLLLNIEQLLGKVGCMHSDCKKAVIFVKLHEALDQCSDPTFRGSGPTHLDMQCPEMGKLWGVMNTRASQLAYVEAGSETGQDISSLHDGTHEGARRRGASGSGADSEANRSSTGLGFRANRGEQEHRSRVLASRAASALPPRAESMFGR